MCYVEEVYRVKPYGIIKFIAAPQGEEPIEIREAWIGVEVMCEYSVDGWGCDNSHVQNVVSGEVVAKYAGYIVLQSEAITKLEKKSSHVVKYWRELGFPQSVDAGFLFNTECVEIIKAPRTYEELFGTT